MSASASAKSKTRTGQGSHGAPSERPKAPSAKSSSSSSSSGKPSDRLNAPTLPAFGESPSRLSPFQSAYKSGLIPCRLEHGSVRHRLSWQQPVDTLDLDPLAIYLAQGLPETTHPYSFLSQTGLQELLASPKVPVQLPALLPRLVPHLKVALSLSPKNNPAAFNAALKCCVQISDAVGPKLNSQLGNLLPSLAKLMVNGPQPVKESIVNALQQFEQNGAPDALAIIKARIPTYTAAL